MSTMTEKEILDIVREKYASDPSTLNMRTWHSCDTVHCLAGWAQHLTGDEGDAEQCGVRRLPRTRDAIGFYASDKLAGAWLLARGYADGVPFETVLAEYERLGGRVIRDGEHAVEDGEAIVVGDATVTRSSGLVLMRGASSPAITQSGGDV